MLLSPGTRLGPYEITGLAGTGGMGQVYRARDTRLDRTVAIKVLAANPAEHAQMRERFDREARAVSSLNHPHICTLHDIGRAEGVDFFVMEFLDGETLASRLARGPLPPDQAIRTAVEIADGLARAHAAGIVHRDLKPGNIFLTESGSKLLDFGLAKSCAPMIGDASTSLPMTAANLTEQGTILGTFQYMAPEQLEAHEVDARSDIFALGSVLYEMVTGRKAFEGKSRASVTAAILERQPPTMATTQPLTPPYLEHIVQRCLVKDPDSRWQTARDLEQELRWLAEGGGLAEAMPGPGRAVRRERLGWVLLTAALVGVAAFAVWAALAPRELASESLVMRFDIATPPTSDTVSFALSPDGRQLTFVAMGNDGLQLWLRPLDQWTAQPLAGTAGASFPFWSPDSRSIGFFAESKLKRIDIAGGATQTLANAIIGRGGTWNRDGVILFSPTAAELFRMPASGGEPVAVTRVARPEQANHRFPWFLPDGRHFVFFAQGGPAGRGVYLGSLDETETHRLLDSYASAVVGSDGRLLFARDGTLFAQGLDVGRGVLTGAAIQVPDLITFDDGRNVAQVSASAAGALAFRAGARDGERRLAWFDRSGTEIRALGPADRGGSSNPELSVDGGRVALDVSVNGNRDIWVVETTQAARRRLTFDQAVDVDATWSPDGKRIAFASNRKGVNDLYEKSSSGAGGERELLVSSRHKRPLDFSRDGRYLLYREFDLKTGWDLLALPLGGDRTPVALVQTRFEEREGQFSPDGKFIAYQSNETGRFEIYVQPFPGPGGKWQVSATGGAQPRWRADGKELFYIDLDGHVTAVSIQLALSGSSIEAGTPEALFQADPAEGPLPSSNKHQYAVSSDGRRFLMNVGVKGAVAPPISIVLNWAEGLRK